MYLAQVYLALPGRTPPCPTQYGVLSAERPETAAGNRVTGAGRADPVLPVFANGPVLILAAVLAAVLIAFSGRYGYHRYELWDIRTSRRWCRCWPG